MHTPLPVIPSIQSHAAVHPRGARARVLLSSVFGPYAVDDEHGSRALNPMELYHNQVTRVQGPFSLRMFHRSWGLMLIQCNITAPCTLLDFPTLARFEEELRNHEYDVVGIGSIPPNVGKVRLMCALIRKHQPNATIVVGGHIANVSGLKSQIDVDIVVQGEGVSWFRRYLGEDDGRPICHPKIVSGIGARSFGINVSEKPGDVAATVIPSVGCPLGCNFCSTSAMFGGKGRFIDFYSDGDTLFDVMCQLEDSMQVHSFFMMDENFLLHRKRALRLLQLMEEHDKAWSLYVFSSANVLGKYTMDELIRLGVSWVWMGLEGKASQYAKLRSIDTRAVVRELQSHGIHVLGSTIVGLEDHTPDNIDEAIDYAVEHDTDFHQFMLYTPVAGTPLHAEMTAAGRMKADVNPADVHGQLAFNYEHPHIKDGAETELLVRAFQRDMDVNGPSVIRVARTSLLGWKRYKNHPDARIRRRFALSCGELRQTYVAATWAARRFHKSGSSVHAKLSALLRELVDEFGWRARLASLIGGPYVLRRLRQEERRLRTGWSYEPPTFYERNVAGQQLGAPGRPAAPCEFVVPSMPEAQPVPSMAAA